SDFSGNRAAPQGRLALSQAPYNLQRSANRMKKLLTIITATAAGLPWVLGPCSK
ncbi:MAG: hypothetical protein ACI8V5_003956, partial [Limisphaerales bacterium]